MAGFCKPIYIELWVVNIHQLPNFNSGIVDVLALMYNYSPQEVMGMLNFQIFVCQENV